MAFGRQRRTQPEAETDAIMKQRPLRIAAVAITGLLIVMIGVLVLRSKSEPAAETGAVTFVLDWFPQPANGAVYAALDKGLFRARGLDVTVQPGGARALAIPTVAAGRAQFGLASAVNLLDARAKGIPVVALAATFQRSPAALFFHRGQAIRDFHDLNGRTVYTQITSPQWAYQKKKYKLDAVNDLQFQGTYAAFANDPRAVTQGYLSVTGDQLRDQGIATDAIQSREDNGYMGVVFTTEEMIKDHPDIVRAFVAVTARAWQDFADRSDDAVRALLPHMSGRTRADTLRESDRQKPFIWTGDALRHGWGWMTRERWEAIIAEQVLEGAIPPMRADDVFTTQFLPAPPRK